MFINTKRVLPVIFLLVCMGQCSASPMSTSISQALSAPCLNHCQEGVLIQSLDTGRTVFERNSTIQFLPASNFKLVVSATALDTLGPDYRMKTSLYSTGQVDNGVLKGDLILVGGGDPVLSSDQLRTMADKVKALGIKTVEGQVVADAGWFDDIRLGEGWEWDSEPYYYSAEVSGLNLDENYVGVLVNSGDKVGSPASVSLVPATDYLTVRNDCTTSLAGSPKTVSVDRLEAQNVIRVTGTVPFGYRNTAAEEWITVDDPSMFTCHTFVNMLREMGVRVSGHAGSATSPNADPSEVVSANGKPVPSGAQLVASVDSPPFSKMLALMNKPSDNLIAECLLKTVGKHVKGHGSTAAGADVETNFLKRIGADTSEIAIADGSGLSRKNCISPSNLVKILTCMYHHKYAKVFLDSLPIAGVDGTLKNRMKGTRAAGNARAKTGSMTRVNCLSGFVKTRGGENLVFSIMLNHFQCTRQEVVAVQNKIVSILADSE